MGIWTLWIRHVITLTMVLKMHHTCLCLFVISVVILWANISGSRSKMVDARVELYYYGWPLPILVQVGGIPDKQGSFVYQCPAEFIGGSHTDYCLYLQAVREASHNLRGWCSLGMWWFCYRLWIIRLLVNGLVFIFLFFGCSNAAFNRIFMKTGRFQFGFDDWLLVVAVLAVLLASVVKNGLRYNDLVVAPVVFLTLRGYWDFFRRVANVRWR